MSDSEPKDQHFASVKADVIAFLRQQEQTIVEKTGDGDTEYETSEGVSIFRECDYCHRDGLNEHEGCEEAAIRFDITVVSHLGTLGAGPSIYACGDCVDMTNVQVDIARAEDSLVRVAARRQPHRALRGPASAGYGLALDNQPRENDDDPKRVF